MSNVEIKTTSVEETIDIGNELGRRLQPGDVITLSGDLGAGKTHFTKGVAKGLDVMQMVNSPTFTIIKEYEGRLPLYHMDVYRLEEDSEEELGLEEYFEGEGVTVVEWPDMIEDQIPMERLHVEMKRTGDTSRVLHFIPTGERYESLCKELQQK